MCLIEIALYVYDVGNWFLIKKIGQYCAGCL